MTMMQPVSLTQHCRFLALLLVCSFLVRPHHAGSSSPPRYYRQLVDHTDSSKELVGLTYLQRYYESAQHFQGPGFPIFLILGGEGAIPPEVGLFYPFVTDRLAKAFGAFVLQPEHRYYGESIPINVTHDNDPRQLLLTPEQALYDAVRLTRHIQDLLQCSRDKLSSKYCPVISVGGSYPGFLSMAARLRFPDTIDISYAASAPVKFYAQQVDSRAYYNHITRVADKCLPGCAGMVRQTLNSLQQDYTFMTSRSQVEEAASSLGFCRESVPGYIQNGVTWQSEVFMLVGYTFANDNMAYYPPSNHTSLYTSCSHFTNESLNPTQRVKHFMQSHFAPNTDDCINMSQQLPTGRNATISGGDWSGVGTGASGESWDFQTCTLLVEAIGFSRSSMFPKRKWTIEWLENHCASRFSVVPQPNLLAKAWHFDDLKNANTSYILFTNGLNDGWSVGGILTNVSETIVSLNFPNGAHHDDLSHVGPSANDTDDVKEGFDKIEQLLREWLEQIHPKMERKKGTQYY